MKRVTLFLILFSTLPSFAQKQGNIWYFGDKLGLDFNSGTPVPLSDGQTYFCMSHSEGSSTISDSSGALLFYTNGRDVWNRNHQLMPNGTGLDGSISASQSSLILPRPGSSRYFYVFTVDAFICGGNLSKGLRYSIVDICLDDGKGDILSGSKNTHLVDSTAEKVTAVKDPNGVDYWIITHKYFSDAFYAFKLSSVGIMPPVISHVGSIHTGSNAGAVGQLKASPNGQKLAIASGNGNNHAELFNFNSSTGIVSNAIILPGPFSDSQAYGLSFSPDNSKVYFSMISYSPVSTQLIQFNLNAGIGDSSSIAASGTIIWNSTDTAFSSLGLQLGPDGKVYFMMDSSVINYPNLSGVACDFQRDVVPLSYSSTNYSFPNFLDSYSYTNTNYSCATEINENPSLTNFKIYPNPAKQSAIIEFNNSKKESYSLTLYDMKGQLVRTMNEMATDKIEIDGSNLTGGLYFFQLRTDQRLILSGKLTIE